MASRGTSRRAAANLAKHRIKASITTDEPEDEYSFVYDSDEIPEEYRPRNKTKRATKRRRRTKKKKPLKKNYSTVNENENGAHPETNVDPNENLSSHQKEHTEHLRRKGAREIHSGKTRSLSRRLSHRIEQMTPNYSPIQPRRLSMPEDDDDNEDDDDDESISNLSLEY